MTKLFKIRYHESLTLLGLLAGLIMTIAFSISEYGVSIGILMGIALIVVGTLCFFIYPLVWVALSYIVRFGAVLALPVVLVMGVGNLFGENNFVNYSFIESLLYSSIASLWGLFNFFSYPSSEERADSPILNF